MSTPPKPSVKPPAAGPGPTGAGGGAAKNDKKAQKQAKRAQQKAAQGGGAGTQEGQQPVGTGAAPSAVKPSGQTTQRNANQRGTPAAGPSGAPARATKTEAPAPTTTTSNPIASDPLQLFLHLDLPSSSSSLSHSSKASTTTIHPSIIKLALQYAEFKIVGANARCIAMLEALKDVIRSYTPPPSTSLSRHLPTHLNPQINHLVRARPLSVSMGTAIRYLKFEIGTTGTEVPSEEAKSNLLTLIDTFIRDRILLADKVIEQHAISKIKDGETILTYARSSVVEGCLLEAWRIGRKFSVVVVDSGPLFEGKNLLKSLRASSVPTSYVLLPSISLILPRISLCLLGTHSLLSNGSMFSRAGTAIVAMMLKERHVPVVCCCETYKFSERVMLDSIVGNEMGSTDIMPSADNLSPLSLLYDVSRPEDVSAVITEAGLIPVQSVGVMLRDYKPLM